MVDPGAHALHRLGEQLAGRVSRPGDPRYMSATDIWSKPVDRTPRAVVHCRTAGDVGVAIRTARDAGLPLSVRGGGHDWAGRALCDGIVIDLREMNWVMVDADRRVAHSGGGASAANVAAVTDPLGVAPVAGSVGMVGFAGLALGGGYGPLIGRFGLALDNLVAAEVVLADGRVIVASDDREEELFWALRGGGGNFGVVTMLHHRLHEMPSVRSGLVVYPFSEAQAVLRRCAEVASSAPDELTVQVGVMGGPDGRPLALIAPMWSGAPAGGEAALAPFLRLGTVVASTVDVRPYGDALAVFDPHLAHGRPVLMDTCWLLELDTRGIDLFMSAMDDAPSAGCALLTHEFKGAASRVAADATAFGLRRNHVMVEILATFDDARDEAQRHRAWVQRTLLALQTVALPGGYPNLLPAGDWARAAKSYGPNARRLIRAKRRYDPDNVFSSAIPLPVRLAG